MELLLLLLLLLVLLRLANNLSRQKSLVVVVYKIIPALEILMMADGLGDPSSSSLSAGTRVQSDCWRHRSSYSHGRSVYSAIPSTP